MGAEGSRGTERAHRGWGSAGSKGEPHLEARRYRRQADVGHCGQPEVDVVCVPEVQAGCLKGKGRDENLFPRFSGFPVARAQTTARKPEGQEEPEDPGLWVSHISSPNPQDRETQTDGNHQERLTRQDIWEGRRRCGINHPGRLPSKGESGGEVGRRQGWAGQGARKGQQAQEYCRGGKDHKPLSVDRL